MLRLFSSRAEVAPQPSPNVGAQPSPDVGAPLPDPLRTLARQAIARNAEAERTLLAALGPALLRTVRGVFGAGHPELEDALQEVMVAVHEALPTFRGECKTTHFACRVAFRTSMNIRRRARYRAHYTPPTAPDELAERVPGDETPEQALAAEQRRKVLRELLDELPNAQSEALGLHIVLGFSVEETAAATGVPRNTVRSRLRAALAALRARLSTSDEWRRALEEGA
jgi:RNA polymerase sigma-70 factor (ECF subfamily)